MKTLAHSSLNSLLTCLQGHKNAAVVLEIVRCRKAPGDMSESATCGPVRDSDFCVNEMCL